MLIQAVVCVQVLKTWHSQDSFRTVFALLVTIATSQLPMIVLFVPRLGAQLARVIHLAIHAKSPSHHALGHFVLVLAYSSMMVSMRNAKVVF